jgi:hypothetical protein
VVSNAQPKGRAPIFDIIIWTAWRFFLGCCIGIGSSGLIAALAVLSREVVPGLGNVSKSTLGEVALGLIVSLGLVLAWALRRRPGERVWGLWIATTGGYFASVSWFVFVA